MYFSGISMMNGCARAMTAPRCRPGLLPDERLVMTTDSHVVSPFFPGGYIGCLAAHGAILRWQAKPKRASCATQRAAARIGVVTDIPAIGQTG
jgi:hypothetical protein